MLYIVCRKLSCPVLLFVKYVVRLITSFWLYRVVSQLYISTTCGLFSWYKLVLLQFTNFNFRYFIEHTFYFFMMAKIHTLVLCITHCLHSHIWKKVCLLYNYRDSILGQSMWNLWWIKWQWGRLFVIISIQICTPQMNPPVQSSDLKITLC
jgi:hypothetical protein